MTDDLVAFIRARLDERAAKAQAAKPGPWHADGGSVYATHPTDEVLAEVDAKRELLSRYEAMESDVLVLTGVDSILSEYRRVILPQLALPYAGHADYKEKWRP